MSARLDRTTGPLMAVPTLLALVVALSALVAAPAKAHWQMRLYTYGETGCPKSERVDPVNVFFWGTAAGWPNTAQQIEDHTRVFTPPSWNVDDGPFWSSPQRFYDHGSCSMMDTERADHASGPTGRFHIRLEALFAHDVPGKMTIGDAHHEDYINPGFACGAEGGHAVDKGDKDNPTPEGSGFDQGRRRLHEAFNSRHHSPYMTSPGNSKPFQQCDKDWAGSDGRILWLRLGRVP